MKKRCFVSACILGVCAVLMLLVLGMLRPRSGVTTANIDRIKSGMTLEEVEGLLGEPGKDDDGWHGVRCFYWPSENGVVAVDFNSSGHVRYVYRYVRDETVLQRICRWLDTTRIRQNSGVMPRIPGEFDHKPEAAP